MEPSALAGSRYLDLPYRLVLTKDKRKGANSWLALVEELPGCEARGDSPEEAAQALREEMAAWMADAVERGDPIPRPRTEPGAPNGRLALEIPQSLHESLMHAAIREGLTVDQLVTISLAGVIRWSPEASEPNARWIQSRADGLVRGERSKGPGVNRALMLNAALLGLVAFAALIILIVAVANGI